jgi:DNA-binding transcriptional ArsR family regulator
MSGRGETLDWGALLRPLVHPTKIWIIEALRDVGRPLSATELAQISGKTVTVESASYHLLTLAKAEVVHETHSRPARGALEKFFTFTDSVKA